MVNRRVTCFVAHVMWGCWSDGKICLGRDYFICFVLCAMLGTVTQSLMYFCHFYGDHTVHQKIQNKLDTDFGL